MEDLSQPLQIRDELPQCEAGNEYDGQLGLRISSIFVIFVGSIGGAFIPIFMGRLSARKFYRWVFFFSKYFGSGVIIATAYIHLLVPALDALTHPCLEGLVTEYDWVEGIILMSIFCLFFIELLINRYGKFRSLGRDATAAVDPTMQLKNPSNAPRVVEQGDEISTARTSGEYAAQISSILILEFGILFHSVFIGLTLAVSGDEFKTLYIILAFHQTFEGLGLGSRLALIPWPRSAAYTPYVLGAAYGLTTPLAIAVGIAIKTSYPPTAEVTFLINGVFDSISAGILIYVGCVELMSHELLPGSVMLDGPTHVMFWAFGLMCLGAGLMALLAVAAPRNHMKTSRQVETHGSSAMYTLSGDQIAHLKKKTWILGRQI